MEAVEPWWGEHLSAFLAKKGGKWEVSKLVGEGASAAVLRVHHDGVEYALKLYRPEFCVGENAAVEQRRLRLQKSLVNHDCSTLVQIRDVGELERSAYVLMEYLEWSSLDRVIGAVQPERIPSVLRDVAQAAKWLHDRRLVHRDIKPANILVANDYSAAKLVDLGVLRLDDNDEADMTDQGVRRPFIATAQYSSPEYLFRLVEPTPDLWLGLTFYQLGGVLHDLLMRQPLFGAQVATANKYVLAMAVHSLMPHIEAPDVPAKLVALAKRCLEKTLPLRLARVQWSDFLEADSFNASAARARLRLRASEVQNLQEGLDRVRRRQELLLKDAYAKLRDCVIHIVNSEKYPRTHWPEIDGHTRCFLFTPTAAEHSHLRLQGTFSVRAHPSQSEWIEVFLEFDVVNREGELQEPRGRPIWTGGLEQFDASIQSDLRSLIADALLRAYAAVDDLLTARPDVNVPVHIT